MVQWLRICLAMQEMWVGSLVRELRSHMHWGTKPSCDNYWSLHALELTGHNQRVPVPRWKIQWDATKTMCATIKTGHSQISKSFSKKVKILKKNGVELGWSITEASSHTSIVNNNTAHRFIVSPGLTHQHLGWSSKWGHPFSELLLKTILQELPGGA